MQVPLELPFAHDSESGVVPSVHQERPQALQRCPVGSLRGFGELGDLPALGGADAEFQRIARTVIEVFSSILNAIGSFGGGAPGPLGVVQSIGGALKLQHGGPIGAGQLAVVGEAGPELFMPDRSGTVLPNRALEAMNSPGSVNVEMRVDPSDLPPPRTPFEAARDKAWLELISETEVVRQQTGAA